MAGIGDTIAQLSTTSPLAAGQTWVSQATLLGHYNSLFIMVKTDASASVDVEWSGDNGINYDAVDSHVISAAITKRIVITTQQATVRLKVTDTGGGSSYLRLYTYGVTTNSHTLTTLVANISGQTASINVANLPHSLGKSELPVTNAYPVIEYIFQYGATTTDCTANNLNTGYSDLWTGGSGISKCGSANSTNIHYIWLRPGSESGDRGIIHGRGTRIRAFVTTTVRFIASFGVSDVTASALYVGCSAPRGNTAFQTNIPLNTLGAFGWFNAAVAKTNDNFTLFWTSNSVARPNWNIDPCDGTVKLPAIDFTNPATPNAYQIEFMPSGNLVFSILNPSDNIWHPIHQVTYLNLEWKDFIGECAFTMFGSVSAVPSSGIDEVRCSAYAISEDTPGPLSTALPASVKFAATPSSGTAVLGSVRMATENGSGTSFWVPLSIASMSMSSSGNVGVTVEVYLDSTVTGGAWSNAHPLQPISANTTATVTNTTNLVYSFELGANDKLYDKFPNHTPMLYGFRILTFVARCTSTSQVNMSVTFSTM